MARLEGSAKVSGVAVAAGVVETLIQLLTVANHRAILTSYGLGGHGTVNTDEPGEYEIIRQTTAGTSSALTPRKLQPTLSEALLTTALNLFTVEPTPGDLLRGNSLHPQGSVEIKDSFSRELMIGGAGRLAIRATFAQAQSLDAYLQFEE